LLDKKNSADDDLAEWGAKFARDPHYALRWSDGAFEAGATSRVFAETLGNVWYELRDGDVAPELVLAALRFAESEAQKHALRMARDVCRSTSRASSAMEDYERAAWAKALEDLTHACAWVQGEIDQRSRFDEWARAEREFHAPSDCPTCADPETFKPSHRGSTRCESGSIASGGQHSHCSCDVCF
jgi:hypothetical protein